MGGEGIEFYCRGRGMVVVVFVGCDEGGIEVVFVSDGFFFEDM